MSSWICVFSLVESYFGAKYRLLWSLDGKHRSEVAQFLTSGEFRFFPEAILSLSLSDGKETLILLNCFIKV